MHHLRLAYSTLFLIALIAIFTLWSQVGGQGHLDLIPWHYKLLLGVGAAFAFVKAAAAAVSAENPWNGGTVRWAGILVMLLIGCGLAVYWVHLYEEDTGDEEDPQAVSELYAPPRMMEGYEATGLRGPGHQRVRANVRRLPGA